MLFDLNNSNIRNLLKKAEFGIERESLRVNSDGTLAQSKHPFVDDPHIDRDFCENQIEIIGDVFYNCVAGNGGEEILLDSDTITKARKCIDEMIRLGS